MPDWLFVRLPYIPYRFLRSYILPRLVSRALKWLKNPSSWAELTNILLPSFSIEVSPEYAEMKSLLKELRHQPADHIHLFHYLRKAAHARLGDKFNDEKANAAIEALTVEIPQWINGYYGEFLRGSLRKQAAGFFELADIEIKHLLSDSSRKASDAERLRWQNAYWDGLKAVETLQALHAPHGEEDLIHIHRLIWQTPHDRAKMRKQIFRLEDPDLLWLWDHREKLRKEIIRAYSLLKDPPSRMSRYSLYRKSHKGNLISSSGAMLASALIFVFSVAWGMGVSPSWLNAEDLAAFSLGASSVPAGLAALSRMVSRPGEYEKASARPVRSHFLNSASSDRSVEIFEVRDGALKVNPQWDHFLSGLPVWRQNLLLYGTGVVGHESLHLLGIRSEAWTYALAQILPALVGGWSVFALGFFQGWTLVFFSCLGALGLTAGTGGVLSRLVQENERKLRPAKTGQDPNIHFRRRSLEDSFLALKQRKKVLDLSF
jgi:hypothetical protein